MFPSISELAATLSKDCSEALRNPVVTVRADGQWLLTVTFDVNSGVQNIGHTVTDTVSR